MGIGGSSNNSESDSMTQQQQHYQSGYNDQSNMGQRVWQPQGQALDRMYGQMGTQFDRYNQQRMAQDPQAIEYMRNIRDQSNPAFQQQLGGGATANMGLQDRFGDMMDQSMNRPSYTQEVYGDMMGDARNTYGAAMKDQFIENAGRTNQQSLANADARAAASGMSGGSRHGLAQNRMQENTNRNLQSDLNSLDYNTFDKNMANRLQIAGMADQNQLAREQMISGMIGQQNNAQQFGIGAGQQMQGMGMGEYAPEAFGRQGWGQYSNAIGRPQVLGSGSQTGSGTNEGHQYMVGNASGDSGGWGFGLNF